MTILKINLNTVKAMLATASHEETRYYLCGILCEIRGDKVKLISTDGHRLGVLMPTEDMAKVYGDETTGDYILARDYLERVAKMVKPKDHSSAFFVFVFEGNKLTRSELWLNSNRLSANEYDDEDVDCLVNGDFPDWRRIVPEAINPDEIGAYFNAEYLGDYERIGKLLTGHNKGFCRIVPAVSRNGPHHVSIGVNAYYGAIMPTTVDNWDDQEKSKLEQRIKDALSN